MEDQGADEALGLGSISAHLRRRRRARRAHNNPPRTHLLRSSPRTRLPLAPPAAATTTTTVRDCIGQVTDASLRRGCHHNVLFVVRLVIA